MGQGGAAQSPTARDAFTKGEIELHVGDFKEAIKHYSEALRLYASYEDAYYGRGKAYFHLQQLAQAKADFTTLAKMSPRRADALHYLGAIAYREGEYREAIQVLSVALARDSTAAIAYNYRAEAYYALGLSSLALADYNKALRYAPQEALLYLGRGKVFLGYERYHEAAADFTQAIRLEPRRAEAYQYRAEIYFILQYCPGAIADLNQLQALNQGRLPPHYYPLKAGCYAQQQDYTRAILALDTALVWQPGNDALYAERAYYRQQIAQYEAALADYTQAARLAPQEPAYVRQCGQLKMNMGNYTEALIDYSAALTLNPLDGGAFYERALCHWKLKNKKQARADAQQAARLGYDRKMMDKDLQKLIR